MKKLATVIIASGLVLTANAAPADTSTPSLLDNLEADEVSVIDDATERNLRGEYISAPRSSGNPFLQPALLRASYITHCSQSFIQCYGMQYISPSERFIKFSFRSTPTKTEYKRH